MNYNGIMPFLSASHSCDSPPLFDAWIKHSFSSNLQMHCDFDL